MKITFIIILFSISFCKSNVLLKDRLLVPIYVKYGMSIGYGDNFFKFSDHEKDNPSSYNYMGDSLTYDSSMLKPEIRLIYSPYLGENITNFIFYGNITNYANIKDKDSYYYSLRFDYKISPYNWLKFGYKYSDNNFLRYYVDNDIPSQEYMACDYRSENFYTNYSFNLGSFGWSRLEVGNTKHFFNPSFTEFDLDIIELKWNYYFKQKIYTFNFMLSNKRADNISYNNGLNSSLFDRSYSQNAIKISVKTQIKNYFKSYYLGFLVTNREYLSESDQDPLHSGRSHSEYNFFISLVKELRYDMNIELKYSFRYRDTNSSLDWVESLKTYKDSQILVKFTHDMDIDLFY